MPVPSKPVVKTWEISCSTSLPVSGSKKAKEIVHSSSTFQDLIGAVVAEHERIVAMHREVSSLYSNLRAQMTTQPESSNNLEDSVWHRRNYYENDDATDPGVDLWTKGINNRQLPDFPPAPSGRQEEAEPAPSLAPLSLHSTWSARLSGTPPGAPAVSQAQQSQEVLAGAFCRGISEPVSPLPPKDNSGAVPSDVEQPVGKSRQENASKESLASNESALEILDVWKGGGYKTSKRRRPSNASMNSNELISNDGSQCSIYRGHSFDQVTEPCPALRCIKRFIMRPTGFLATTWDVVLLLNVVQNIILLPIQAFSPDAPVFLRFADNITIAIYMADILFSFLTGFIDPLKGVLNVNPQTIAHRYLRHWFTLDVCIVLIDWVPLIFYGVNDRSEHNWLWNLLPLLKLVRLLKGAKLAPRMFPRVIAFKELIKSETQRAVLSVLLLIIAFWVMNHFIACGFYAISRPAGWQDTGATNEVSSWVELSFEAESTFRYRYLTAYHWSMTQITPAGMEVVPVNTTERAFNVGVIFFGLLMFSSFVASMTESITYLRQVNLQTRREDMALLRYISDNHVSADLAFGMTSFFRTYRTQHKKSRLHEEDVAAFKILPESLLVRLHVEVYSRSLESHALFEHIGSVDEACFGKICHHAMSQQSLLVGEELFRFGDKGSKLYFSILGSLQYFLGYEEQERSQVRKRQWLSEASLWVFWEHRGRLTAQSPSCELVLLDTADFHTTMTARSSLGFEMERYAKHTWEFLKEEMRAGQTITDLWSSTDQATRFIKQAWRAPGSDGEQEIINKVMMIWDANGTGLEHFFIAWKYQAKAERESRNGGNRYFGFRSLRRRFGRLMSMSEWFR